MRVAFFDRDGTIIKDYPDECWRYVEEPEFIPEAISTLKRVQERGYEIIIVTNQYLINEKVITLDQYNTITRKMLRYLSMNGVGIRDIFYCPHGRDEGCDCIKPNTGMIEAALKKYPMINIKESFVTGDSWSDMKLAMSMGMKGFGIKVTVFPETDNIIRLEKISDLLDYI